MTEIIGWRGFDGELHDGEPHSFSYADHIRVDFGSAVGGPSTREHDFVTITGLPDALTRDWLDEYLDVWWDENYPES